MKELTEGIENITVFDKENTLRYAKIFEDSSQSPLALAWNNILKEKVKGYYYLLAHLPDKELKDGITIAKISGFIQCLEMLIKTPADFMEAVKEIDKEEGNQP